LRSETGALRALPPGFGKDKGVGYSVGRRRGSTPIQAQQMELLPRARQGHAPAWQKPDRRLALLAARRSIVRLYQGFCD
jgi:hypothetical protein